MAPQLHSNVSSSESLSLSSPPKRLQMHLLHFRVLITVGVPFFSTYFHVKETRQTTFLGLCPYLSLLLSMGGLSCLIDEFWRIYWACASQLSSLGEPAYLQRQHVCVCSLSHRNGPPHQPSRYGKKRSPGSVQLCSHWTLSSSWVGQ